MRLFLIRISFNNLIYHFLFFILIQYLLGLTQYNNGVGGAHATIGRLHFYLLLRQVAALVYNLLVVPWFFITVAYWLRLTISLVLMYGGIIEVSCLWLIHVATSVFNHRISDTKRLLLCLNFVLCVRSTFVVVITQELIGGRISQ